jgi:cobalt-zinc-cadmium efflux system protein
MVGMPVTCPQAETARRFSSRACFAEDGERILREASDRLKQGFNVYFSTIQIEEECLSGEENVIAIDITKGHERFGQR